MYMLSVKDLTKRSSATILYGVGESKAHNDACSQQKLKVHSYRTHKHHIVELAFVIVRVGHARPFSTDNSWY